MDERTLDASLSTAHWGGTPIQRVEFGLRRHGGDAETGGHERGASLPVRVASDTVGREDLSSSPCRTPWQAISSRSPTQ